MTLAALEAAATQLVADIATDNALIAAIIVDLAANYPDVVLTDETLEDHLLSVHEREAFVLYYQQLDAEARVASMKIELKSINNRIIAL